MKTDKIQKLHLAVTPRVQFGKNLKKMRHQGFVPANVFGPGFKSVSISTQVKDFSKAYKTAHETGVVYLDLNKDEIPTLIGQVQRHPVSNAIIHVDFRKIDLKQKIETTVPVKSDHVLIEALPEEIPQEIEIDLSKLLEIGAEVRVKDLPASSGYVIKEDPEKILLSIIAHKEESVTPETTVATPEVLTEKEGDLTAEGTATEGAAPVEDKKAAELKEKTSEKKEKTS